MSGGADRARERDWRKRFAGGGLSGQIGWRETQALTVVFHREIAARKTDGAIDALGALGARFASAGLDAHPAIGKIACRKGCGFCCHQKVTATAPEIFHMAAEIRASSRAQTTRAKIAEWVDAAARAAPDADHFRLACAILDEEFSCAHHLARPVACRGVTSLDVEPCKRWLATPGAPAPAVLAHLNIASAVKIGLWASLSASGLDARGFDLIEGLAVALADETAPRRFLAGEAVFAGVRIDISRPPEVESVVARLAALAAGPVPDLT